MLALVLNCYLLIEINKIIFYIFLAIPIYDLTKFAHVQARQAFIRAPYSDS